LGAASYYDGFETDRGWVVGSKDDNATKGIWERGAPEEVCDCFRAEPYIIQPGADHSPDPGSLCYVTGAALRSFFPIDGQTTLTSPVLSVAGITDPRIALWRWYRNRVADLPGDDPAVTQLSSDGGATWTTISSAYFPPVGWEYVEFRLRDFIPTANTFQIRFIAANPGEFSEAETLIDDFALFSGSGGTGLAASFAAVGSNAVFGRVGPSPSNGGVRMRLSLPVPGHVTAEVFDASGRLVSRVYDDVLPMGPQTLEWNGRSAAGEAAAAGVYFMQVRYGDQTRREKFVVLR
jgi:hypothetical protein